MSWARCCQQQKCIPQRFWCYRNWCNCVPSTQQLLSGFGGRFSKGRTVWKLSLRWFADLQNRQMNMDYVLCQTLKNTMTSEEKRVIFVYDINCQYMVKLMARIKCGVKHLWIWPDLFLVPGIGLFHVHGHQEIYAFHDLPQHLSQGQVKQMERYWRHCGLCSMRSVTPPGPWLWHTDWKYWMPTCWITTGKKWSTWVPF